MNLFPIDIHTHLSSLPVAERYILNSAATEDWERVAMEAERFPGRVIPAFGVHPWFVEECSGGWLERLEGYLERFPQALVGEAGLDKARRPRVPLEIQVEIFRYQWSLARKMGRPVVLHCVRAWGELLPLLQAPATPFLCHAFNGAGEYIRPLAERGAYFSLGPREASSSRIREILPAIPSERLLMESDGSSYEEFSRAHDSFARMLGWEAEEFSALLEANAERFLNKEITPF